MKKITLYHGTPDRIVTPKFGGGDDKHDYGRGFYLTENIELAKETRLGPQVRTGVRWTENSGFSGKKCSRMAG